MPNSKRRIKLGRYAAAALDLPEETCTGCVKATLYAASALVVENHKGVFECAPERIRLRTGEGILRIEGNNMALMEFSDERALIRGEISLVSFEK